LELTFVKVEYETSVTEVRALGSAGRTMKGDVKSGEAREGDDHDGGGGGSGSQGAGDEGVCPTAATWELERDDRLFQRNRPQQGGDTGDSFLEGSTIRTDGEMRLEENGLELGELMVGAQRQLLTGLRTFGRQYRPLSHPTFRRVEYAVVSIGKAQSTSD
jgi:hypothetical protein